MTVPPEVTLSLLSIRDSKERAITALEFAILRWPPIDYEGIEKAVAKLPADRQPAIRQRLEMYVFGCTGAAAVHEARLNELRSDIKFYGAMPKWGDHVDALRERLAKLESEQP
jgi:hypothetical protein